MVVVDVVVVGGSVVVVVVDVVVVGGSVVVVESFPGFGLVRYIYPEFKASCSLLQVITVFALPSES